MQQKALALADAQRLTRAQNFAVDGRDGVRWIHRSVLVRREACVPVFEREETLLIVVSGVDARLDHDHAVLAAVESPRQLPHRHGV